MADELVDIVDETGQHTGTAMKSVAHATGLWHYSIHCWIVNPTEPGYVLFQRRGPDKVLFPNLLDISAAGHYRAGERTEQGVREIVEELGIQVAFSHLVPLGVKIDVGRYDKIINREFCHVFLLKESRALEDYQPSDEELSGLVQMSIAEGLEMFDGVRSSARCSGVTFNQVTRGWEPYSAAVTVADFIPRVDPYYLKVFIMADRLLRGIRPLAI